MAPLLSVIEVFQLQAVAGLATGLRVAMEGLCGLGEESCVWAQLEEAA